MIVAHVCAESDATRAEQRGLLSRCQGAGMPAGIAQVQTKVDPRKYEIDVSPTMHAECDAIGRCTVHRGAVRVARLAGAEALDPRVVVERSTAPHRVPQPVRERTDPGATEVALPGLDEQRVFAIVLGILNAFLRPILLLLTLPLNLLTLGLFTLVVNAIVFWIASGFDIGVSVHDFGAAFLGALVVSAVSFVASRMLT